MQGIGSGNPTSLASWGADLEEGQLSDQESSSFTFCKPGIDPEAQISEEAQEELLKELGGEETSSSGFLKKGIAWLTETLAPTPESQEDETVAAVPLGPMPKSVVIYDSNKNPSCGPSIEDFIAAGKPEKEKESVPEVVIPIREIQKETPGSEEKSSSTKASSDGGEKAASEESTEKDVENRALPPPKEPKTPGGKTSAAWRGEFPKPLSFESSSSTGESAKEAEESSRVSSFWDIDPPAKKPIRDTKRATRRPKGQDHPDAVWREIAFKAAQVAIPLFFILGASLIFARAIRVEAS